MPTSTTSVTTVSNLPSRPGLAEVVPRQGAAGRAGRRGVARLLPWHIPALDNHRKITAAMAAGACQAALATLHVHVGLGRVHPIDDEIDRAGQGAGRELAPAQESGLHRDASPMASDRSGSP